MQFKCYIPINTSTKNIVDLNFKKWLEAEVVYSKGIDLKGANIWGDPGTTGNVIKGDPIKHWVKKQKKK